MQPSLAASLGVERAKLEGEEEVGSPHLRQFTNNPRGARDLDGNTQSQAQEPPAVLASRRSAARRTAAGAPAGRAHGRQEQIQLGIDVLLESEAFPKMPVLECPTVRDQQGVVDDEINVDLVERPGGHPVTDGLADRLCRGDRPR